MCYDEYELSLRERIEQWLERQLRDLHRWNRERICSNKGHDFADFRTLTVKTLQRDFIEQRCTRCNSHRFIDPVTRELTDESESIYGILVLEWMEYETNIYSLMPKTMLGSKYVNGLTNEELVKEE